MTIKYIGRVTDRLNKQILCGATRVYATREDALQAAERLCKRTVGERGRISVDEINVPMGRPTKYGTEPAVGLWISIPQGVHGRLGDDPKGEAERRVIKADKKGAKGC